ncbi:MAG TPA: hypothetical protein VFG30_43360 [Polyangiales bacterium]|jgi:hypothetical protein|nr:hypothetical protein [Polyangiales bacterium]
MFQIKTLLPLVAALLLAACGSTTSFVSSWKSPTAHPLELKGEKVAAVVMMADSGSRKAAEDMLAKELSERGVDGVALYRVTAGTKPSDEAQVRAALEEGNFKGAVVMHPVGKEIQTHVTTDPDYDPFWGGYYAVGWGSPWVAPVDVYTDTIVSVDTRVYSFAQNQLVWEGKSKTTNPKNVDALVAEVASATADKLDDLGLLKGN